MERPKEVTAMVDIFLARITECGKALVDAKDILHLDEIIIFGSVIRGEALMNSDIDLMAIIDGTSEDASRAQDYILEHMYDVMERDYPFADVHTCSRKRYETIGDPSSMFEGLLENVRKDGASLWKRQSETPVVEDT